MKKIMMMLTVSLFTGQLMAQSIKNTAPTPPPIHQTFKKVPTPPQQHPNPPVLKATLPPPTPTPPIVKSTKIPAPLPPPPATIARASKKLKNKKETIQFTPPVILKDEEK